MAHQHPEGKQAGSTSNSFIILTFFQTKYKSFGRVIRHSGMVTLLARGARGCVENGVATTKGGELAIACPACPRENINISEDWRQLPPAER